MEPNSPDWTAKVPALTRRSFVGRGLQIGSAASLLSASSLACFDDDSPSDGPTAGSGSPRRGGTLIFSQEQPPGFDPAKWWNGLAWNAVRVVFDSLYTIDPYEGKIVRQLATGVEVSPDGTTYTFKIRPGVKFHHGRALTADDVKFSIERVIAPATASEGASLYTGLGILGTDAVLSEKTTELEGVRVIDDTTLAIRLAKPESALLHVLAMPFCSVVPRDVVEKRGEDFNWAPVGSGPFEIRDVDRARGFVLVRNADYWNPDVPYVDRIEVGIDVDPELATLRIERGEQDMMSEGVPSGTYSAIRNDPKFENQLHLAELNLCRFLTMSTKHEALRNLPVRQAVAMAVDRDRLVRALLGLGTPATGGIFAPSSPYFQRDLGYSYDPDEARRLLADAGYEDGFAVTLWTQNLTGYREMGQTVAQDLQEVGIKVDVQTLVPDAFATLSAKNPIGMIIQGWELAYPHGSYIMDGAFTQAALDSGCCNYSRWVDPEFEKLIVQAHRTTDSAQIEELYKTMDRRVVRDQALWVPLIYPKWADIVSARVRGFQSTVNPNGQVKILERYWIDEA